MDKFRKISYEDLENDDFDCEKTLFRNVLNYFMAFKKNACYSFDESLCMCESPIEQMLSIAINNLGIERIEIFNPYIEVLDISKQKHIVCFGKKYRADFFIEVCYKDKDLNIKKVEKIIVECDGREYHHSTSHQVNDDYERTLNLQKAGYSVIKFTGSQINRDPNRCAKTILDFIISKMIV